MLFLLNQGGAMFGSLQPYSKVPASFYLIVFTLLPPSTPSDANISFPLEHSSLQADTPMVDRVTSSFIFISFAGRRYFKEALKSEYIIKTWRLPVSVYNDLRKVTSLPKKHKNKAEKQSTRFFILIGRR